MLTDARGGSAGAVRPTLPRALRVRSPGHSYQSLVTKGADFRHHYTSRTIACNEEKGLPDWAAPSWSARGPNYSISPTYLPSGS